MSAQFIYRAYCAVEDYAKFHNAKVEYGSYMIKNSSEKLLTENEFHHQFRTNHFVVVKLVPDFFIIFCNSVTFSNSTYITTIKSTVNNFAVETLFVVESLVSDVKINNLVISNRPRVNYMYAASFFVNPLKHVTAPRSIKKIDYGEIEKVVYHKPESLSKYVFVDPIVAWMRYKPGDVIEEQHDAPNCGTMTLYRIVV